MNKENNPVLRSFLLFMVFVILQCFFLILLYKLLSHNKFGGITIDISFLISIFIGLKILDNKQINNTNKVKWYFILGLFFIGIIWRFLGSLFKFSEFLDIQKVYRYWDLKNLFIPENLSVIENYNLFRIIILTPVLEEVFYRRLILNSLSKKINILSSLIISSLFFAFGHLDLDNFIFFFIGGVLLGYTYLYTKKIIYPILLHCVINILIIIL